MSYDRDHETDVLASGAVAAFAISQAPMLGVIAGVRICRVNGEYVINPNFDERKAADINLVIAGTSNAITMVEGGATEASEEAMLDILELAQENIAKICACIEELRAEAGLDKVDIGEAPQVNADVMSFVEASGRDSFVAALAIKGKHERKVALKAARNAVIESLVDGKSDDEVGALTGDAKEAWEKLVRKVMRTTVIAEGKRIDGRATDEIRDIWCELGIAPRAHGSAIFTR